MEKGTGLNRSVTCVLQDKVTKSTEKRQNASTRQGRDKSDNKKKLMGRDWGWCRPLKELGYLRSSWAAWISVLGVSVDCSSIHFGPSTWWPIYRSLHGPFACSGPKAGPLLWAGFFPAHFSWDAHRAHFFPGASLRHRR